MTLRLPHFALALAACAAAVPALATAAAPTNSATAPTTVAAAPSTTGAAAPPMEPIYLGDDPALDGLAQSCFSGDLAACDALFEQAPYPSAYSEYGYTCAGRRTVESADESLAYCVEAFPPTMEPLAIGAVQPGIFASGDVVVPSGVPGTVSVALHGAPVDGGLPVIVRNDTNTVVREIFVTVVGRDAAGAEIARGQAGYFTPASVVPGGWAMNTIPLSADIGADTAFEFTVEYRLGTDDVIIGVPVTEAAYQPAGQRGPEIIGTVTNDTSQPLGIPVVHVACFDGPALTDVHFAITEADEIPPGGTSSFTAETYQLNGEPPPCPSFAVAAIGSAPLL